MAIIMFQYIYFVGDKIVLKWMKIHWNYILFIPNYDNSSNDLNKTMLPLVRIVKFVARIK